MPKFVFSCLILYAVTGSIGIEKCSRIDYFLNCQTNGRFELVCIRWHRRSFFLAKSCFGEDLGMVGSSGNSILIKKTPSDLLTAFSDSKVALLKPLNSWQSSYLRECAFRRRSDTRRTELRGTSRHQSRFWCGLCRIFASQRQFQLPANQTGW